MCEECRDVEIGDRAEGVEMRDGEIHRNEFLTEFPLKRGIGALIDKYVVDWSRTINTDIYVRYNNIVHKFFILNYNIKNGRIYFVIDDKIDCIKDMNASHFKEMKFKECLGYKTSKYKYQIDDIIDTKLGKLKILNNVKLRKSNGLTKGYEYECLICGNKDSITESDLKKGQGCNVCCDSPQKIIEGINDIPTTAPFMIEFFQGGYNEAKLYTKSSGQKIIPKCPDCELLKDKKMSIYKIYKNKSIGCPRCGDGISYPEKFMFNLLEQLQVNFTYQFSPDWIKPKRYDFYFEKDNKKYIVETDGGWHNTDNNLSGQCVTESEIIDKEKDTKAKKHGINVIRIDCCKSDLEYIQSSILNSVLNVLFDLSKIDWLDCESFALSNRVKKACELWNNGIKSTLQIGKTMNLSINTIIRYLKKGYKLGWTDYTVEISNKIKGENNSGKNNYNSKKIINIDTMEIFNCISDAKKKYKGDINKCLKGKSKKAGGCRWGYYTKE